MNTPPKAPTPPNAPAPTPTQAAPVVLAPVERVKLCASESIAKLAQALAKAQGKFVTVEKDATNPFFNSNYATLAAIIKMIRKPLADNGISFVQTLIGTPQGRTMKTIIIHESGEWLVSEMPCFGVSNKPQDVGSATTYAKRYGLQAAFGIAVADDATDDDGNKANGNTPPPKSPVPPVK